MNVSYLNRKPSRSELKEGQVTIATYDGDVWLYSKLRGMLWKAKMVKDRTDGGDEVSLNNLFKLAKVLGKVFKSGLEDGQGFDIWEDEQGTHLELDNLRVRNTLTVKEFRRMVMKAVNGNLFVGSSAKVRLARQR